MLIPLAISYQCGCRSFPHVFSSTCSCHLLTNIMQHKRAMMQIH